MKKIIGIITTLLLFCNLSIGTVVETVSASTEQPIQTALRSSSRSGGSSKSSFSSRSGSSSRVGSSSKSSFSKRSRSNTRKRTDQSSAHKNINSHYSSGFGYAVGNIFRGYFWMKMMRYAFIFILIILAGYFLLRLFNR